MCVCVCVCVCACVRVCRERQAESGTGGRTDSALTDRQTEKEETENMVEMLEVQA